MPELIARWVKLPLPSFLEIEATIAAQRLSRWEAGDDRARMGVQGPERLPEGRRTMGGYVTHRFGAVASSSWRVVWMVPSKSGGREEDQVVRA